jgi:hypothetical protein
MRLRRLDLCLDVGAGPLRPQVLAALEAQGEPLRWAITAVEATGALPPGVQRRLRLEAVVLCRP